jgi:hypothetical protein
MHRSGSWKTIELKNEKCQSSNVKSKAQIMVCHSGLDPESSVLNLGSLLLQGHVWIPAFEGMTVLAVTNVAVYKNFLNLWISLGI